MQGLKRKILYATLYELVAMTFTTLTFVFMVQSAASHAGFTSIMTALIALIWNLVYNTLFEYWEIRQHQRRRTIKRRILHALGFELGLVFMLVPLFSLALGVSLWQAFMLDLGLIVFFLVYTYLFNLIFDVLFGLPASAQTQTQAKKHDQ
ncbi:MAG: PACE efflux transporter [Neisseriaceae bacterium]|nr:PACE efflux transporter [Neisseriaceae bacterium]